MAVVEGLTLSDKLLFSEYQEGDEMMFNTSFVEVFAKVMSEITKMTIAKLRDGLDFDNYRVMERLQHCMFNNVFTLSVKSEHYFLKQRLLERLGETHDEDFENKA